MSHLTDTLIIPSFIPESDKIRAENGSLPYHQLIKLYGTGKNNVRTAMLNSFHFPTLYLHTLRYYKLTTCAGTEFGKRIAEGCLRRQESGNYHKLGVNKPKPVQYQVIYQDCNPYSVKRAKELQLSWRAAHKDFGLDPIVIVRISVPHE